MRFLRRSLTGLFLVSLTLGLLAYAGQLVWNAVDERVNREPFVPPARERVFAVNVLPVVAEDIAPDLTAFGEVQSRRTLDIRAARGGAIVELADNFVEGGEVEKDQLLARIDPAEAQAALDRVSADLRDAEAEVREAERALELAQSDLAAAREQAELRARAFNRQQDLAARGVGTAAAVETAELAAAAARQQVLNRRQSVAQAEARIDQAATRLRRAEIAQGEAERALKDTEIRAEFAGTLADVAVVQGGIVGQNERLAQLIDGDALEVAFRVSTAQYARLLDEAGNLRKLPARVALDVLGMTLTATGTISRDSAAVGTGQTGRLIFASLDSAPGLKPGDFVTVRVTEPVLEQVVRLPSQALDAQDEVLVIGEDDRLEELAVTLLRRQGDDVLVRAPGLEGREVVAERTPLLGAGIKVKPLRGDAAKVAEVPQTVTLDPERRARLVEAIEGNTRMPDAARTRILAQLQQDEVPARMVERIEERMAANGGDDGAGEGDMVTLDPERRARLMAAVEAAPQIPAEAKARLLEQLQQPQVPARMVARIEARMGG